MKKKRIILSIMLIVVSSLVQSYIIESMMKPSNIISMGFTGLSILLHMSLELINIKIPVSFFMVLLNLPIALLCAKSISKKFTLLSVLQIALTSLFLEIFEFKVFFHNTFLDITIGAVIYGLGLVAALKAGGSTGGTDFIALYVSNKINKTIWEYVFLFNVAMLLVFGYIFGFENAGYSLIFQYITTKTIETFYKRYDRVTLQIMTKKSDEIINKFTQIVRHGITKTVGTGGYTKEEIAILYTVISFYEVQDVVRLIREIDEDAIINIVKTENFYGKFYLEPI